MEIDQPVILDDVARLSGVSRATASRALGDKPGVADDVRRRVRTIAEALNYRPNRAARSLAGARTSLIGLLLGGTHLYRNAYSARFVDAMAKSAHDFDQGLLLVMSKSEPASAVDNLLRDRIVDGVVVSSVVFGEPWAERLIDSDMPTVLIGPHPERPDAVGVHVENVKSTQELVGHLFDTGYTRIGMITGPALRVDAQERYTGFEQAHRARGFEVDPTLVVAGDFQRPSGHRAALTLLDRGVDAIFAANDNSAFGALDACDERGVLVPDQVGVAGFDGASNDVDLTTVVQPLDRLASAAVNMVVTPRDRSEILLPELRIGATTRPRPSG